MLGNYENFKTQIYDLFHVDLNYYKERQMKRRIDSYVVKYKCKSYQDFVTQLRTDKISQNDFFNYLTINVTEFYRNPEQWKILEQVVIPKLINQSPNGIKVWSAACSTGEEPYSCAMLLAQHLPLNKFSILATDLSDEVLEVAKKGIYSKKGIDMLPFGNTSRYFKSYDEKSVQIEDSIRNTIQFKQHNLLYDKYPLNFDLIICRNVLIYFTEEAKERVYIDFNQSLKNGGVLFIGSTEQIIRPKEIGFDSIGSFFYCKN